MGLMSAVLGLMTFLAAADPAAQTAKADPPNVWDLSDAERDAFAKKWDGPKVVHEIQVLNARREPLPGAVVKINSLIPLTRTTDAEGWFQAEIPYVVTFGEGLMSFLNGDDRADVSPLLGIDFVVDHPDYPVTKCRVQSRLRKQEFRIEEGGRLQLMGRLAEDPAPVHGLIPQFNSGQGVRWSEQDGLLSIRRIDRRESSDTKLLRIVHLPDAGPAWFSDILDPRELATDNIPRTLTLKRGIDVSGRLSDDVPRPIQNGWVVSFIGEQNEYPNLGWITTATVDADGTFTLTSLPPSETVQIIAVCDGWTSSFQNDVEADREGARRPTNRAPATPAGGFVQSRFHRMSPDQPLLIPMERTSSFEMEVVDTENRPLPGVTFECNPHKSIDGWGSSYLAPPGSTIDYLRRLTGDADPSPPVRRPSRFPMKVVSDENGIARFDDIPCPATGEEPLQVMLQFDTRDHRLPGSVITPVNFDAGLIYADVAPGKRLRTKIRLTPVPKQADHPASP